MRIYIIEVIRDKTLEVEEVYFKSEEEAIVWLTKKYGQWLDPERLYIYYNGLWRFRKGNENSIRFSIKPVMAA